LERSVASRWLEFLIGPGRLASEYVHACGRKVREIMTPRSPDDHRGTPLDAVVQLMEKHRIKRLPVVREGEHREPSQSAASARQSLP